MNKEYRKADDLKLWEKNPRSITKEKFEHLKKLLKKHGQFKPVIINGQNVVVGGNMRLRALKELGVENIWVSVVEAETEAKMLEYALADNESSGEWDEEDLGELLTENWIEMEDHDFEIDVKKIDVKDLLEELGPDTNGGGGGEPPLGEKVSCPKCGFEFDPEESGH